MNRNPAPYEVDEIDGFRDMLATAHRHYVGKHEPSRPAFARLIDDLTDEIMKLKIEAGIAPMWPIPRRPRRPTD